jgi:hypothetical protein
MRVMIAGLAVVLAQASGPGSKGREWCFDRGQDAQLCEATEAECNKLRAINTEITQGPCRRVEPPDIQVSRRPNRRHPRTRRGRPQRNDRAKATTFYGPECS